jgi:hypothetical protein
MLLQCPGFRCHNFLMSHAIRCSSSYSDRETFATFYHTDRIRFRRHGSEANVEMKGISHAETRR